MASAKPLIRWFIVGPVYDAIENYTYWRIDVTRGEVGTMHGREEIDRARAVAMIGAGPAAELEAIALKPNGYASWGWRV